MTRLNFERTYAIWRWWNATWVMNIVHWVRNYRHKTHTAKTCLKKGEWYDTDTRLFECVFGLLVQFVEEESSIENLEWSTTLDSDTVPENERHPYQAEWARETLRLYRWYKYERAKRVDPFSGIAPEHILDLHKINEMTPEYREWLLKEGELQEQYEEEDTKMAQAVLEIRRGLWT